MNHQAEIGALTWHVCQTCANYKRRPVWCKPLETLGSKILRADLATATVRCTRYTPKR